MSEKSVHDDEVGVGAYIVTLNGKSKLDTGEHFLLLPVSMYLKVSAVLPDRLEVSRITGDQYKKRMKVLLSVSP